MRIPAHQEDKVGSQSITSLRWVVGIRYKISLLLFAILIVAYSLGVISISTTIKLAITNLLYLLASAFYSYILNQNPKSLTSPRLIPLIRNLQVPELLLLATTATYYSGGVLSPLFILFPLAILQAIILLPPAGVYRTGALAVLLYCSLALLELSGKGQLGVLLSSQQLPLPPVEGGALSSTYALYLAIVSSVFLLTAYIGNRLALLIRQRNQQIEAQLQDSQTLYQVANELANMIHEADMLTYLAATLKSLDNASICLIGLFNKEGNLERKASAGAPLNLHSRHEQSELGVTSSAPRLVDLLQRGEALVINDIHQHPHLKEFAPNLQPHSRPFNSAYIFPIKAESLPSNNPNGIVIGCIILSFDTTHHSSLITHHSSLITHHSSLITHHSSPPLPHRQPSQYSAPNSSQMPNALPPR